MYCVQYSSKNNRNYDAWLANSTIEVITVDSESIPTPSFLQVSKGGHSHTQKKGPLSIV